jgi:hypothetical protein
VEAREKTIMLTTSDVLTPSRTEGQAPEVKAEDLLCLSQERILFSCEAVRRMGSAVPINLIHSRLQLDGPLDVPALKAACAETTQRNNAFQVSVARNPAISDRDGDLVLQRFLRTGLVARGLFLRKLSPDAEPEFHRHDFRELPLEEQQSRIDEVVRQEAAMPFAEGAPLAPRVTLIQQHDLRHLLIITTDHRISDGWSDRLLRREVERLYGHFAYGSAAPPAPNGYAEFTLWQNQALESSYFDEDLAYWERQWHDFASSRICIGDLAMLRSAPVAQQGMTFQTERITLDESATANLRAAARALRAAPHALFQSAFAIVLRQYTKKNKIALWSHCANRKADTANTIGYLINTHLSGFEMPGDLTLRRFVADVVAQGVGMLKHEQMPLPHLWRTLQCFPRVADSGIMLDYNKAETELSTPRPSNQVAFSLAAWGGPTPPRMAPLGVYVTDRSKEISIRSDYTASLYKPEAVRDLLQDIATVVRALCSNPEMKIAEFSGIAARYTHHPEYRGTEMDEFNVSGSHKFPFGGTSVNTGNGSWRSS